MNREASGAEAAGPLPAVRPTGWTGYLAATGYMAELLAEIGPVVSVHDRLAFAPGPARPSAWAANVWLDPVRIEFASIGQAANALRAIQRNWVLYPTGHFRRASLIEARLPVVRPKPLRFRAPAPAAPLGSWTLIEPGIAIAAPRCTSPFPNGEVAFVEDREGPPNRAYLKLWEALTLLPERPGPGQLCVDLGASPGGWTWVLQGLGARVVAVDKAPLAPRVAALPRVEFRRESAFALDPRALGPVDWLFCDVVCYPDRLLALARRWIEAGTARRCVFTIKFQGATDDAAARAFAALPGSRLVHLHHNKHELTWIRLA